MNTLIKMRAVLATGARLAIIAFAAIIPALPSPVGALRFHRGRNKASNNGITHRATTVLRTLLSNACLAALLTTNSPIMAADSAADPVVGTWKLNLAKSTFGGPALQSEIRTYSHSTRGLTLKMTSVSAAGRETTTQSTYQMDGTDHPSMGNPDFDTLSGEQIDANTAEFTLKRAGKPVGKLRRAVSKDGHTLTINRVITSADGVQRTSLTVFDRQ